MPLAVVSSLAGIHTERLHRLASQRDDPQGEKLERPKRPKPIKEENKTLGYANSPSCNFSFNTVSGQSRNKLLFSSALKGLEKLNHSHLSELSLSQHVPRATPSKKSTAVNIRASLIDRIKKRHLDKPQLSPKAQNTKVGEIKDKGKFLNIALGNAKNVNMFEINNYFSAPQHDEVSIASQSVASKRVESKVLELAKQKAQIKLDSKQPPAKSARQPENRQITSLQTKLSSITAMWKSKQTTE